MKEIAQKNRFLPIFLFRSQPMKKYKHIIWDWNGTIVNDRWLSVEVLNGILRDFNLPPQSEEEYRENFSFPVIDYYRKIGFEVSREKFEEIGRRFIKNFNAKRYDCKLNEGAPELVQKIFQKNVPQSVLSAYEKNFLNEALEHFGLKKYMSKISGLSDINANTKLELGLRHVASLNLDPEEIIIIGDTDHDYAVAAAANTQCALVSTGHQSASRLKKTSAKVFENFAGLEDFLMQNL